MALLAKNEVSGDAGIANTEVSGDAGMAGTFHLSSNIWKCNLLMNPHVRWSVGRLVGRSVILS